MSRRVSFRRHLPAAPLYRSQLESTSKPLGPSRTSSEPCQIAGLDGPQPITFPPAFPCSGRRLVDLDVEVRVTRPLAPAVGDELHGKGVDELLARRPLRLRDRPLEAQNGPCRLR